MGVPLRPFFNLRERENVFTEPNCWILEFSLWSHCVENQHHIISYHIISYHVMSLSSLLYENNVNIWYMMIIIFHYHLSMSLRLVFLCLLLSISPHYLSIHLSIHLPIYLSSPPSPVWFFCASGRNLSESSWFNPILIFDTPYPLVN